MCLMIKIQGIIFNLLMPPLNLSKRISYTINNQYMVNPRIFSLTDVFGPLYVFWHYNTSKNSCFNQGCQFFSKTFFSAWFFLVFTIPEEIGFIRKKTNLGFNHILTRGSKMPQKAGCAGSNKVSDSCNYI